MVPLPICMGTLRVAERMKSNRGRRSAQSGEDCGVAARAKSRKRWRRREGRERRGGEKTENEEEADDEEQKRKLKKN